MMNADPSRRLDVLSAQVAIVTGAGRGIGRAIALALAGAGARVALVARSRDQLDETAALIQQTGGQADQLSGRFIHVNDDVRDLVRRAGEIEKSDLYTLRVRRLE